MTQEENGNIENVKLNLDIEIDNENSVIEGYLGDARAFFDEQLTLAGLTALVNPTTRQKSLMEQYAEGKYVLYKRPEHSDKLWQIGRSDIKTHVRGQIQKQTDDGVATGTQQFLKTSGNVRDGNGL